MRNDQTDTCHGTCEADCSVCNAIYEPNFKPVDVRMTMMAHQTPSSLAPEIRVATPTDRSVRGPFAV